MSSFDKYRELAKGLGKTIQEQTEGKDLSEVFATIKKNAESLLDPKNMADMMVLIKGKSPEQIKEILQSKFKDLSESDLDKLVEQITKEDGVQEVFDTQVKEQKKQVWTDRAKEIKEARLAKERGEEAAPKKETGGDLLLGAAKLIMQNRANKKGPKN